MDPKIRRIVEEQDKYFATKSGNEKTPAERTWIVLKHLLDQKQAKFAACLKSNPTWFVGDDDEWLVGLSDARRGTYAEMKALGRNLAARGFPARDFELRRVAPKSQSPACQNG
jgi:hypothetical protein